MKKLQNPMYGASNLKERHQQEIKTYLKAEVKEQEKKCKEIAMEVMKSDVKLEN